MDKKEIKKQLLIARAEQFEPDEPEELGKDELIEGEEMRTWISETEIDLAIYIGLQEYDVDGVWNEVRKTNKKGFLVVIDEAPESESLDVWVDHIHKWLEVKID